ncbi:MAG: HAD family hydrolase [Chloroflexi bacterium]|nr:HAD family hydrolase [Chloroflexota bacterium]
MMMDRRLVLFDIDGTLLHSGGCGRAATRLATQEVFGTLGAQEGVSFAGKTDWQILLESLEPAGISRDTIQHNLDTYNQVLARTLAEIIHQFPVRACIGAREVVAVLRDQPETLVGLVTGNVTGIVPIKLRAAAYDPADFKVGAYGSEGWERPMLPPLALRRAIEYSGFSFTPDQVVIIGDTPGDVSCAASIGARTIAVATGPYSGDQLRACQPNFMFENMADTEKILAAIWGNSHSG